MCDIIEYRRGTHKNILIEFERDAGMRVTAVFIIAISPSGEEEGMKLLISDKGKFITTVAKPQKLIEGVDIIA